jgi:hypothetical protein
LKIRSPIFASPAAWTAGVITTSAMLRINVVVGTIGSLLPLRTRAPRRRLA